MKEIQPMLLLQHSQKILEELHTQKHAVGEHLFVVFISEDTQNRS